MQNKENQIVTRDAFVRNTTAEMLDKRQVEFVISSEAVDSYRTIFEQSGADFSRFSPKGIVLNSHKSNSGDEDDVLGYGEIFREGDKTIGRVTFEPKEINERADKIFRKIQNGTPYMASVGASVQEASYGEQNRGEDPKVIYFRKWTLLEFSVVPIGSNPDAQKRNTQTIEEIRTSLVADIPTEVEEVVESEQRNVQEAQVIINKNRI